MPPLTDRIAALYAKEPSIGQYLRFVEARHLRASMARTPERFWPACAATALEAARQFLGEEEASLAVYKEETGNVWRATLAAPGTGGCRGGASSPMEAVVALWEAVLA